MRTTTGTRWARRCGWLLAAALAAPVLGASAAGAGEQATAFDGFIQSGTCAKPTDDVHTNLASDGTHDVEPYKAKLQGGDKTVLLGYYGDPEAPGFAIPAIYTDQQFSLVIASAKSDEPVACGDILEPTNDDFTESGTAAVQLLPVEGSGVEGIAILDRGPVQREVDAAPTRVRILLTTDAGDIEARAHAPGFNGYVQGGYCDDPTGRIRVKLETDDHHDVEQFRAAPHGGGEPVTVAYYGGPRAPGFSVATTYTDQRFSLVLTDVESKSPVACGNILEPDDDDFTEVGVALVELSPIGDSGVQGFAVVQRTVVQREVDVTPTRMQIAVFAPPATGG